MRRLIWALLGWVASLGGVDLDHGWCYRPWWIQDERVSVCEFDARACTAEGSCGPALSVFEERIEHYLESLPGSGPRWHKPAWMLRVRGAVPLRPDAPYRSTADNLILDCGLAQFFATVPDVPATRVPRPLVPGSREVEGSFRDGDIVVPDGLPYHTMPIGNPVQGPSTLLWAWDGPRVPAYRVSTGRLIVVEGELTQMPYLCPVYCRRGCRWREDGTARTLPFAAVEMSGKNNEDAFVVLGMGHPGDYSHVNGRSRGRGVGYLRVTGAASTGSDDSDRQAELRGRGALYLNVGGVMTVDPRVAMAGGRLALVGGNTHRIRIVANGEQFGQLLWAPTGCLSCQVEGAMNEFHGSEPWNRGYPLIHLGTMRDGRMSGLHVELPHLFVRKGTHRSLVRADGPVALSLEGSGKNFDPLVELGAPTRSRVAIDFTCIDRPGGACEVRPIDTDRERP